jgi:hypothetical protein
MNGARKKSCLILVISAVLVTCGAILFVEGTTKVIRRWVDDVVYDNRNHYLSCEQLPTLSQVERVIEEHQDVIRQIEAVNPGFVGVEIGACGAENADITFWYATHRDRGVIQQIIGGDAFFGVPYNLNNR